MGYQIGDEFEQTFRVKKINYELQEVFEKKEDGTLILNQDGQPSSTLKETDKPMSFNCETTLSPGARWGFEAAALPDIKVGHEFSLTFKVVGFTKEASGAERTTVEFKDYSGGEHQINYVPEVKAV